MHVLDVFAEPRYRPLVPSGTTNTRPNAGTVLAVPLLRGSDLFGVITVWRYDKRLFSDKQVAMVDTFAAQVAQRVGIAHVIATANRLGIASGLARDASLALGTSEVNLLELVSAYAPFANGGYGVIAYGITDVWDADGHILYRRAGTGPGRVVAPELVGAMNRKLASAIFAGVWVLLCPASSPAPQRATPYVHVPPSGASRSRSDRSV